MYVIVHEAESVMSRKLFKQNDKQCQYYENV